ncbi:MAG: DUF1667 domain-containing protein [Clostridia bacterium]
METRNLVCIQCPIGCNLTVNLDKGEVVNVEGNTCKRGEIYAKKEVIAPTRTVTSTIKVLGGKLPVVSVKTSIDIPKDKIFECMKEINKLSVKAPVKIGDIIIQNVCQTTANIIATSNC